MSEDGEGDNKPLVLDMSFGEALERFLQVNPSELKKKKGAPPSEKPSKKRLKRKSPPH